MTSLTHAGITHRNTDLFTQERAEAFATMIQANPHFRDVTLQEQPKAKGKRRWFVSYRPSNQARRDDLREFFQAVQDTRAETQWPNYVVTRTAGGFLIENQQNGKSYLVALHPAGDSCTCPQMEHRCAKEGLRCKHPRIVQIHQALGLVQEPAEKPVPAPEQVFAPPAPSPQEARRAQVRQWMVEDFGPAD